MFYSPPTHEEPVRTRVRPLLYYRLTYAASLLLVGTEWKAVRTPSSSVLTSYTEGVNYFIGGHEYDVSEALFNELADAGFPSLPEPHHPDPDQPYTPPVDPENPDPGIGFGYGYGGYGEGRYGGGIGDPFAYGRAPYGSGPYGGS